MTIIDILEKYRIPFRRHGEDKNVRQGWIGMACPFCGRPEDKRYLGYNLEQNFFSCWSCGYLKSINVVSALSGESIGRCREMLGRLEQTEPAPERVRGRLEFPGHIQPLEYAPAHRDYLRRRGFNVDELIQLWRLQAIGISARLTWRIFIPIIWHGEPVSWTTRAIGNVEPRYISALPSEESIHHKHIVYGGDYVRHAVVIHEGPADVWATGPGAVATFGIGFSPEQVLWLSQIPLRYVCLDAEDAAQRRALQLCDQLGGFPGETYNVVLDAKDAGSASQKERRKLRELLG